MSEYHHNEEHHHHEHEHNDDHLITSTNSEAGEHDLHHHHHHHHDNHNQESHDFVQPSAPTIENGYIVVPPTPQTSVVDGASATSSSSSDKDALVDELTKVMNDVNAGFKEIAQQVSNTIVAEADSSNEPAAAKPKPDSSAKSAKTKTAPDGCSLCPYYLLACDLLSKMEVPPRVKDLLLWKDMKLTGAVFGSSLVLLISLAAFSLLTVVSTLFLMALIAVGAYRFYLGLIFRIKGNYDNTFEKLSSHDLSLPKDKIKQLVHLLENDVNRTLNLLKSIVLWDNLTTSLLAFAGFYVMYCVGSMFNTITLLILALVSAFTLPKVYTVYKVQIDQAIEKTTAAVHQVVKQVLVKIPILNKKKTQ